VDARRFDVFLSYNSADRSVAEAVARRLLVERISPWWDRWALTAGSSWQSGVAEGLRSAGAFAILVGPSGLGDWAREELAVAQDRAAREPSFRIFMVLLPGAPDLSDPALAFVRMRTWVDLRNGPADGEGIDNLVAAISGRPRRDAVEATPGICPYRGLEPFEENHAEFFCGRANDVAVAVEALRARRFLAVVGSSGSGKSSLIQAGLIPALRSGALIGSATWTTRTLTPGSRPLTTLIALLTQLFPAEAMQQTLDRMCTDQRTLDLAVALAFAERAAEDRMVLVADQFEELFTLCADEDERRAFLTNLAYAATVPGGRTVLVVGMRADFYHRCAPYPDLRALLSAPLLIGPLDREGRREAIEVPAARVGIELEAGLTDTILADVSDRPGTLPLLEHVLLDLWQRRRGSSLTLEAYVATGGAQGALEQRADAIYAGLTSPQKTLARRILLRLVQPGEGTEDTRRRADMDDLVAGSHERDAVAAVVKALADGRLITIGHDEASGSRVVELVHEAVIRGWPELRAWVDESREVLLAQRRLTEAALEWERSGRDDSLLYRGARLTAWQEGDTATLAPREGDFLLASARQEQDELDMARKRIRRSRQLATLLGILLAAAIAGGLLALRQRHEALVQRQRARSGQLTVQAAALMESQPDVAALLSVEAYHVAPTSQARNALLSLSALPQYGGRLTGPTDVKDVAYRPDGSLIATADGDRTVMLWDASTGSRVAVLYGHSGTVNSLAFSGDSRLLASAGDDNRVVLWDVESQSRIAVLTGHTSRVETVSFSPDSRVLVSVGSDRQRILWDVESRSSKATMTTSVGDIDVAFSPDGRMLAVASFSKSVSLLDAATLTSVAELGGTDDLDSVAFSPDGRTLAAAGAGAIRLWDVPSHTLTRELSLGEACCLHSVTFGGGKLAATTSKGAVVIWNLATGDRVVEESPERIGPRANLAYSADGHHLAVAGDRTLLIYHPSRPPILAAGYTVHAGALSPDKRLLASVGAGPVRLYDLGRGAVLQTIFAPGPEPVISVALSPDGRVMAGGGGSGTVWWWDVASRTMIGEVRPPEGATKVSSVVYSPDGRRMATADATGTITVWDAASRTRTGQISPTVSKDRKTAVVTSMVFSRESKTLIAGNSDGNAITFWDVASHAEVGRLEGHAGLVSRVALSPDGRVLASASADSTVILWDIETRIRVATLANPGIVDAVAFSPDGRVLASRGFSFPPGTGDPTLILWNVANRQRTATIPVGWGAGEIAFAGDGDLIVVFDDVEIRLLDMDAERVARRICDTLDRSLTPAEWATYAPGLGYRRTCG